MHPPQNAGRAYLDMANAHLNHPHIDNASCLSVKSLLLYLLLGGLVAGGLEYVALRFRPKSPKTPRTRGRHIVRYSHMKGEA